MRFSENSDKFHRGLNAFAKLDHEVERLFNNNSITNEKLNNKIDKYDILLESCEGIPGYICKRVRAKYIDKNLPLMMIHVTEIEIQEHNIKIKALSPTSSFCDNEIIVQTAL